MGQKNSFHVFWGKAFVFPARGRFLVFVENPPLKRVLSPKIFFLFTKNSPWKKPKWRKIGEESVWKLNFELSVDFFPFDWNSFIEYFLFHYSPDVTKRISMKSHTPCQFLQNTLAFPSQKYSFLFSELGVENSNSKDWITRNIWLFYNLWGPLYSNKMGGKNEILHKDLNVRGAFIFQLKLGPRLKGLFKVKI